jgi:polyisoprenoid-binding protein YceI
LFLSNVTLRAVGTTCAAAATCLLGLSLAMAAPETYIIDPSHSNLGFSIAHFFSKVPGHFNTYEGRVIFDEKDLAGGSVELKIDATSIDTNEPDRDNHLKSPDFFDVAKYPDLTFKSTSVKALGPKKAQVQGTLTMHGVSKPVTLDVDFLGAGPGLRGGRLAGFEARTKINRQDFGVAWNKVIEGGGYVLGNDVDILLNIEAMIPPPTPAAAKPAEPAKK